MIKERIMFTKLCQTLEKYNITLSRQEFDDIKSKNIAIIDELLTKYKLPFRHTYHPLSYGEFSFPMRGCLNYSWCLNEDYNPWPQSIVNSVIDKFNQNHTLYAKPIDGNCLLYLHPIEFKTTCKKMQNFLLVNNYGIGTLEIFYKLDLHKTDNIKTANDYYPDVPKLICKNGYNMDVFVRESLTFTVTVIGKIDGQDVFTGSKVYTTPIYYPDCGATGVNNIASGIMGCNSVIGDRCDYENNVIALLHPGNVNIFKDFDINCTDYTIYESIDDKLKNYLVNQRQVISQTHNNKIDTVKKGLEYLNYVTDNQLDIKFEIDSSEKSDYIYNSTTRTKLREIKTKWNSATYVEKKLELPDYKSALELLYLN